MSKGWLYLAAFVGGAVVAGVVLGRGPGGAELEEARDRVEKLKGRVEADSAELVELRAVKAASDSASRADSAAAEARIEESERRQAELAGQYARLGARLEGMISDTARAILAERDAIHLEQVEALESDKRDLRLRLTRAQGQIRSRDTLIAKHEAGRDTLLAALEAKDRVIEILEEKAKPGWQVPGLGFRIPTIVKDLALVAGGWCAGRLVAGEGCF